MTYDNIKEDVLALGFTETIEDESTFILALNRALNLLSTEFPKVKTLLLTRTYVKPKETYDSAYDKVISLKKGEKAAFLYHRYDGAIFFERRKLPLSYGTGTHLFTAEEDGTFTIEGDGEMFAISIYDSGVPEHMCEVNLPYVEYEILKYDTSARVIPAPPTTVDGDVISGAMVDGLTVRMPKDYSGIFMVRYEKSPTIVQRFTQEIELDERLFPLLSLLVCGYYYLEDEPERSQYYMALYREGRERMRGARASYTQKIGIDALGWT